MNCRALNCTSLLNQIARWVVLLMGITLLAQPLVAEVGAASSLLKGFEGRTTEHVFENGWTFIIVERPVAPVFTFVTVVDVGAAQEVPGITGLAHMFEHMAFKGTPNIGSKDYPAEKIMLQEVEAAYQAYEAARRGPHVDAQQVETLLATFRDKQTAAAKFVQPNEFGELVEKNGGTGLNAFTNSDFTTYHYSLPVNRFELFAYLESERFLHPVFREFYKERDVVQEERRTRIDSRPEGRMAEQALSTAFLAHPYHQPVVGYMSDLQSFTATDAEAFFKKYYVPANMVTTIVGQVKAEEVLPMLRKYFERIPRGPKPPALRTEEPQQIAEKTVVLRDKAQPVYAEMYHKPSALHDDQEVYDAIDDILTNGRTSRLYRSLVSEQRIAAFIGSIMNFPGSKYPSLWFGFAVPSKGRSNEEVQAAMRVELEKLKEGEVSDAELRRFRNRAKADLLRQMNSNTGIALQFSRNQTLHGDWRELFRTLDAIDAVTREDIQRVARAIFVPQNRTVAMIVTEDSSTTDDSNS